MKKEKNFYTNTRIQTLLQEHYKDKAELSVNRTLKKNMQVYVS